MTGTRDPQQDGSIHAMLSDSGLESAAELRSALEQLRAVVPDAAPAPRADLAALLAAGATGPTATVETTTTALPTVEPATTALPTVETTTAALPVITSAEAAADESLPAGVTSLAERRGQKRRLAIVGGAVVGAMTLGAGAVAASSEDFRHSVSQSVGVIFQPSGNGTPASEHVQPSPSPSSVPALPAPAAAYPAGTPGVASSAPSSARTRAAKDGDEDSGKQSGRRPRTTPPVFGRDGILPSPGQRPGLPAPGLPGNGNGNGNGNDNEDMPRGAGQIVPTLPGVVPTTAPGNP
jgi:hypothetical protein